MIPTKVEVMPGKHWLKLTPETTLTIGEYALVEILSPSDINQSVWDFRVDPRDGGQSGVAGADFEVISSTTRIIAKDKAFVTQLARGALRFTTMKHRVDQHALGGP